MPFEVKIVNFVLTIMEPEFGALRIIPFPPKESETDLNLSMESASCASLESILPV